MSREWIREWIVVGHTNIDIDDSFYRGLVPRVPRVASYDLKLWI
jgi:hypothetical protein